MMPIFGLGLRIKREVWILSLALLLLEIGWGAITPFVMILLRSLGASFLAVGFVASIYNLILALSFLLGASLGDKLGGKFVFVIGAFCTILASISYAVAFAWLHVALGLMFGRLAWGFRWASSFSIVSEASDDEARATSFGIASTLQYVGGTVGPIVGGLLASYCDLRMPFYLALPLVVISTYIVVLKLGAAYARRSVPVLSVARIRNVFRIGKGIGFLIVSNMIAQFFYEFGNPFYTIFMKESLGSPEYVIGLAASVLPVGSIMGGLPGGILSDKTRRRKPFIVLSSAIATIAVAFTAFSSSPWMVIATFFLFGVSNVISINTVSAYFLDVAGSERTMVYGVYVMAGWLTATLSPPVAGFIAESYGLRTPFLISLGGLALATLILATLFKERR